MSSLSGYPTYDRAVPHLQWLRRRKSRLDMSVLWWPSFVGGQQPSWQILMLKLPWEGLNDSLRRVRWEWGFSCSLPVLRVIGTVCRRCCLFVDKEGAEENGKVSCCVVKIFCIVDC